MRIPEVKILSDSKVQNFINQNDFESAANYLFNSQMKSWDLMRTNYDNLRHIESKAFWSGSYKLKIQFNPGRIKSTSAEVDEKSIKNRKCFLCLENLPMEQKGIFILEKFVLLCNPYPILSQHITVASIVHEPQRILEYISDYLLISKLLSNSTLIYNGPSCGASAPDHLHFQAVTKQVIPIENDIQQLKNECGITVFEDDKISTSFINDGFRKIIFIESTDKEEIVNHFMKIYLAFQKISESDNEPLMNLLCSHNEEFGWNLIIYLRSKHRPEVYFSEEPKKLIISPAAVDMGGLIVSPRKEDFERIDLEVLQKILNEVSLSEERFLMIREKVKSELS